MKMRHQVVTQRHHDHEVQDMRKIDRRQCDHQPLLLWVHSPQNYRVYAHAAMNRQKPGYFYKNTTTGRLPVFPKQERFDIFSEELAVAEKRSNTFYLIARSILRVFALLTK